MKTILSVIFYLILSASFALGQMDREAQQKTVEMQRAEIKKLDALVGKWQGSGWMQRGKERETFTGTELVQRKIDGLALLVEGRFVDKNNIVIHETLGVISYNPETKQFDLNAFLATGRKGAYIVKVTGEGWQWGFSFPGGMVRYNIKLTSDTWHETGEFSMDEGKTWMKTLEMNLKKVQ